MWVCMWVAIGFVLVFLDRGTWVPSWHRPAAASVLLPDDLFTAAAALLDEHSDSSDDDHRPEVAKAGRLADVRALAVRARRRGRP